MITIEQARTLSGRTMHGADGQKLGKIDTLYADREGGEPTFATIHTGAFGTKTSFVPLDEATMEGEDITVPYDKDLVHAAPSIDPDAELEPAEEDRLYQHYGVGGHGTTTTGRTETADTTGTTTTTTDTAGYAATGTTDRDVTDRDVTDRDVTDRDVTARTNEHGTVGHDTSGPTTDDAMTRSEERLKVGTRTTETGRARLRKYVVTENVTQTVPVSREEVRVEREPITEANAGNAYDGPAISEEEHEVVLHEEKPVVAKETVPVERVRLGTETVQDEVTVNETVRKEQIDTDGVYPEGDSRRTTTEQDRTAR